MKILFLSLVPITDLQTKGLYTDLLRKLIRNSHSVTAVFPSSEGNSRDHSFTQKGQFSAISVNTGQVTKKKNAVSKGLLTILVGYHYKQAINRYCRFSSFDLVLYVTPPISFSGVVRFCKKKYKAKSYLMLKDIFPQNAIDLGMLPTWGPWKIVVWWLKHLESRLYMISDYIGCMSPKNVSYLLEHQPTVSMQKLEVCPNSIELTKRRDLPIAGCQSKPITFLYGGNIGKPQDIPFLIDCLKDNINKKDRKFIICGTGTETLLLQSLIETYKPWNIQYIPGLPVDQYDKLILECDVGMIFLDHRFTIPNFPSRILSYMEKSMPILACTDKNTDVGEIITQEEFGWWCESKDVHDFTTIVDTICSLDSQLLSAMGNIARTYLEKNYTVEHTYDIIMKHFL